MFKVVVALDEDSGEGLLPQEMLIKDVNTHNIAITERFFIFVILHDRS